jgi:hypothetical protein
MKKTFVIILFIFLWSNQVLAEANSEGDPMYYNEPSKRIYILWDGIGKKDHFEFTRYVKEGAESVFVNFPGGYGSEVIAPLIEKYKLPVFVGRHCYSACTIISTRSPTLYASADSKFMFHEGRADSLKGYNIEDYRFNRQRLNTEYRKAGATDEFIELMNSEREKDTSKYDQAWEIWLTCKELKKYFTKNQINCNSISDSEGIDFIINNHPNLKKFYCLNDKEEAIVEVFFNPSCPINYTSIKKEKFEKLKQSYSKINEENYNLNYNHDFGKLDMLINEIGKISEAGIVFDFDEISKKHGFKSFKDAVSKYKKKFKVKIKVKQAKDYFTKVDQLIEIDYSQENLDKLYDILINNKIVRKRSTYFKEKKAFPDKALAGCIDLKKELARLTIDPNSKSPELYVWGANWNNSTSEKARAAAIYSNKIWTEKQKIPPSSCDYIIIDVNDKSFLTESYIKEYIKEKNL